VRHCGVSEGPRDQPANNFLAIFAPVLAKNGGGAIANLNSVASFVSFPILATYSASKAATHSLTQVTRAMLRGQNTQVFGVYPARLTPRWARR
jgi:short-subunit dehydrogenase